MAPRYVLTFNRLDCRRRLINTWSIWLKDSPRGCAHVTLWIFFARKFGTSYNQIVRCGKLDQSTTIIVPVLMQTVTASVLAVHWLPTDFCVEVPQDDYEVMPGTRIYDSSESAVKKVLLIFLFIFGRGVNVYEAYIEEFASHAQGA